MCRVLLVLFFFAACFPSAALAQLGACWDDGECTMTTRENCCGCWCEDQTCDDPSCHCFFLADPGLSSVSPWDEYGQAFVAPGSQSGVDEVTIRVVQSTGSPYPCAEVYIFFECLDLCIDPEETLPFVGETDIDGYLTIDLHVGGCGDCEVWVRVGGVSIGYYTRVVSTDWDGSVADGTVGSADFAFFASAFKQTQDYCADYNGDGIVSATDFSIFAASFMAGDQNGMGCR